MSRNLFELGILPLDQVAEDCRDVINAASTQRGSFNWEGVLHPVHPARTIPSMCKNLSEKQKSICARFYHECRLNTKFRQTKLFASDKFNIVVHGDGEIEVYNGDGPLPDIYPQIQALKNVVGVAVGDHFCLALLSNGTVVPETMSQEQAGSWCWREFEEINSVGAVAIAACGSSFAVLLENQRVFMRRMNLYSHWIDTTGEAIGLRMATHEVAILKRNPRTTYVQMMSFRNYPPFYMESMKYETDVKDILFDDTFGGVFVILPNEIRKYRDAGYDYKSYPTPGIRNASLSSRSIFVEYDNGCIDLLSKDLIPIPHAIALEAPIVFVGLGRMHTFLDANYNIKIIAG